MNSAAKQANLEVLVNQLLGRIMRKNSINVFYWHQAETLGSRLCKTMKTEATFVKPVFHRHYVEKMNGTSEYGKE